ncbi:MAG: amino acid ABC transporter permease, partial [Pseudomonadota bacterium]
LAVIAAFFAIIWLRISGTLNYKWNWGIIPNYILRWDDENQRWVANLLLEGLITTIRVSLYASVLALVLGIILGIARCSICNSGCR